MDRKQAVERLLKAGKRREISEIVARHDRSALYGEIRGNDGLSDKGRRYQLAVAALDVRRAIDAELSERAEQVAFSDREDMDAAFGTRGLPGDAATLTISRRDALDRAEQIVEPSDRLEALRRAIRSGDDVLVRAIAQSAMDKQDSATVNAFIEHRPELEAAVTRLWNGIRDSGATFQTTMDLAAAMPAELVGTSEAGLEAIVREGQPVSAPVVDPPASAFAPVGGPGAAWLGNSRGGDD